MNVRLDAVRAPVRRAAADRLLTVVPVRVRARRMTACATGSRNVLSDLSESLHGVRTVAAHNRQRYNIVHHRNVVGDYQRANNYTAQINADLRPGHAAARLHRAGGAAGDRRQHGARSRARASARWSRSSCTSTASLRRSSCSSSSTTPSSRGRRRSSSCARCWRASRAPRSRRGATELPPVEGEIVFDHVTFGYDPAVPVSATSTCGSTRARPSRSSARTGAGKSTLAKLITRFYDPTAGADADRRS